MHLSPDHPSVRWWPRLTLADGTTLYNIAMVGEEGRGELFMVEFPGEPRNPPRGPLHCRRLAARHELLQADFEQLATYVRWKALEWLNVGCETYREAQLRLELRRWREQRGLSCRLSATTGSAWRPREDEELLQKHRSGASLHDLARAHGRTPKAIRCRLAKLRAA